MFIFPSPVPSNQGPVNLLRVNVTSFSAETLVVLTGPSSVISPTPFLPSGLISAPLESDNATSTTTSQANAATANSHNSLEPGEKIGIIAGVCSAALMLGLFFIFRWR